MDPAHEYTERQIAKLTRRYRRAYLQAIDELDEKMQEFEIAFADEDEQMRAKVEAGEMSEKRYKRWRATQVTTSERWEHLQEELAQDLVQVDQIAQATLEGTLSSVYIENYAYSTWQIHKIVASSTHFTMYNRYAAARLVDDFTEVLPEPSVRTKYIIDETKDLRWQNKTLKAHLLQGLLQGESIPDIAKRLPRAVCETNFHGQIRRARTMMTNVQNLGRIDCYEHAQALGLDIKKQWAATLDNGTRDSHREIAGEIRSLKEKFSNGLMRPGDPDGRPEEVYNCRCTTYPVMFGEDMFGDTVQKLDPEAYKQWKEGLAVVW